MRNFIFSVYKEEGEALAVLLQKFLSYDNNENENLNYLNYSYKSFQRNIENNSLKYKVARIIYKNKELFNKFFITSFFSNFNYSEKINFIFED